MAGALEDIKVLDFTRMYAGPFCTMLLKDLGAEVIKVEIPGGGDAVRSIPPITQGGEAYIFLSLNRGKKSVTLDLQNERGCQIARELVKHVDVVVENYACGVMERLGLGYEELDKINPRLIYASLSGFGHTGPRSSQTAFDTLAQAMGGLMSVTGFVDGPPTKAGPALADFVGALYTSNSILAALHHRSIAGKGQHIDISMQDSIWAITALQFSPNYYLTGEVPERLGNRQVEATPFSVYPAKDGYVVIAIVTIGQWQKFLEVIEREDLLGVEKYANQVERIKHCHEIDSIVEAWTSTRSIDEIVSRLNDARLPCSPVPTFDQVANDPHLHSREMIIEVEQLISGTLRMPGSVFKLSATPGDLNYPAPFLGQDNYEVYSGILGYTEQEIHQMASDGII